MEHSPTTALLVWPDRPRLPKPRIVSSFGIVFIDVRRTPRTWDWSFAKPLHTHNKTYRGKSTDILHTPVWNGIRTHDTKVSVIKE